MTPVLLNDDEASRVTRRRGDVRRGRECPDRVQQERARGGRGATVLHRAAPTPPIRRRAPVDLPESPSSPGGYDVPTNGQSAIPGYATACATSCWKRATSCSLSPRSCPSATIPERTPFWTRSTRTRSSAPTWRSNSSSSSTHAGSASAREEVVEEAGRALRAGGQQRPDREVRRARVARSASGSARRSGTAPRPRGGTARTGTGRALRSAPGGTRPGRRRTRR